MENKTKPNILFLINNLGVGGAEGVFLKDAEALGALGYNAQIYTLYPNNFQNLYDFKGYLSLIKKIRKENISRLYSTLDDANFVAKVVRIFTSVKLFCREANETHDKSFKFKIADILLNFGVYKLVMVAEAVKRSYLAYDPYHKNKMVVLYNGVTIPEIKPKPEIGNLIKILAVGSLTKKKGLSDLALIIKDYVINNHTNFLLEIIGDGPLFAKIVADIKGFGLENNIKCLGSMNKAALIEKYLASDIFVLTSKKEGCPNVLLEAASYGLAPVCFAVGGVPEIIENNISGIVVERGNLEAFGQALNSLLDNPSRIREMGKEAREQVKNNFSFDLHIKNLINLLELAI